MTEVALKPEITKYTRDEFKRFLTAIVNDEARTEEISDQRIRHFKSIVPHPAKTDLIFWPEEGADDSPEGIVAEIERYCRENGLPCFKDSDF